MRHARLGRTGLTVSRLCLETMPRPKAPLDETTHEYRGGDDRR